MRNGQPRGIARAIAVGASLALPLAVVPMDSAYAAPYRQVSSYYSKTTCLSAKYFSRIGDRPPKIIQKCVRDDGFPGYDWKYYTILVYPDGNPRR